MEPQKKADPAHDQDKADKLERNDEPGPIEDQGLYPSLQKTWIRSPRLEMLWSLQKKIRGRNLPLLFNKVIEVVKEVSEAINVASVVVLSCS